MGHVFHDGLPPAGFASLPVPSRHVGRKRRGEQNDAIWTVMNGDMSSLEGFLDGIVIVEILLTNEGK